MLTEIDFDDAPDDFKQYLIQKALERAAIKVVEKHLGRKIEPSLTSDYVSAWKHVHTGDNAFFKLCARLVFEYHVLDRELTQTLLLGMTRARYSSVSALAHFDCTGKS